MRGNYSSTRFGSTSKKAVASISRPSSSAGPSERSNRLLSSSARLSSSHRVKPGSESTSRLGTPSRPTTAKGLLDETVKSFDFLKIGRDRRKWENFGNIFESSWVSRNIYTANKSFFMPLSFPPLQCIASKVKLLLCTGPWYWLHIHG